MELRERREDDLPELLAIAELTVVHDRYPPHWHPRMTSFPKARSELASYVTLSENSRPVGHVALHATDADSAARAASAAVDLPIDQLAVVARLYIHPDHRRSGLARRMLNRALTDAHALGRRPILDVWDQLAPAIAFYEHCGWERICDITIHFGSPCTDRCVHEGTSIHSYVYLGPPPP